MKKIIIFLASLFFTINLIAQASSTNDDDKTVTITVTGQGNTIDEAKTNALRSAIEQAFGTFISSNTTILNDNLVKDEIVSVTNGNIQKYDVLNETPMTDGSYVTTLKATVSVSKLTSFCESKGVVVEFKGGLFTINIKQQILNEQAEIKAIWETLFLLNPILNQSFDYELETSEPKSLDDKNLNWEIPLTVSVTSNKNIDFVFDYLKNSLKNISLTAQEVKNYKSLGKKIFEVKLDNEFYNFRKVESQKAILFFFEELPLITRNFIVEDGLSTFQGYWFSKLNKLKISNSPDLSFNHTTEENNPFAVEDWSGNKRNGEYKSINSFASIVAYSFSKKYTLDNLEKLSKFKVCSGYSKTRIGTWYNGGRIVYIDINSNAYISPLISCDYFFDGNSAEKYIFLNGIKATNSRTFATTQIPNLATDTLIGSGYLNSDKLLKYWNTSLDSLPADICRRYSTFGFHDWFLPSKNELKVLNRFHNSFCTRYPYAYNYTSAQRYLYHNCISSSQYYRGTNDKNAYFFSINGNVNYFDNYKVDVIPIRWEKFQDGSYVEALDINKHLEDIKHD